MPVDSKHRQYQDNIKRYQLVRAIVDNKATNYIRQIDITDPTRSQLYRDNAILTNFTALTKNGLVGLVFRKPSTVVIPSELNYILDDSDGKGLALDQLAQRVTGELLETGRHGLLVDYPPTPPGLSKADADESLFAAKIYSYKAEDIINWHTTTYGSIVKLSMVVLQEQADTIGEDGFEWTPKTQYRVLRLSPDRIYTQDLYDQDLKLLSRNTPLNKDGQPWNEIPFSFVGSENNDPDVDNIPLYDIAIVNLGHYRNSADLEENAHICGLPTFFLSAECSNEEFKSANPNGIIFGGRDAAFLGANGSAQLLQASPNQLITEIMKEKTAQVVSLGARLISPPGGRETAEAARIRFGSQHSSLYTYTKNIAAAFEECLEWLCGFMGGDSESVEFVLNDQFYDDTVDPLLLAQEILLYDRGLIKPTEMRDTLRISSIIDPSSTDTGLELVNHMADPMGGNPQTGNN